MTTALTPYAKESSLALNPSFPTSDHESYVITGTDGSSKVIHRASAPTQVTGTQGSVYWVQNIVVSEPRAQGSDFDNLLLEVESDPTGADLLKEGRAWVAENFYEGTGTLSGLRLKAGLSQKQLAQICEMDQPHVSRYESGRVEPGVRTARTLAHALGVSLEVFVAAWEGSRAALEAKGVDND